MDHSELRLAFQNQDAKDAAVGNASVALVNARVADSHRGLRLAFAPVDDAFEFADLERFVELLSDPRATGNRESGWNFANPYVQPHLRHTRVETRWGGLSLEIHDDGRVVLRLGLGELQWGDVPSEVHPYPLIEHITAAFRLAAVLYKDVLSAETVILVDLALDGADGWTIRGGTPSDPFFRRHEPKSLEGPIDWGRPRRYRVHEIAGAADSCAFRLVKRLYAWVGLLERDIPRQFDRVTRRLVFES